MRNRRRHAPQSRQRRRRPHLFLCDRLRPQRDQPQARAGRDACQGLRQFEQPNAGRGRGVRFVHRLRSIRLALQVNHTCDGMRLRGCRQAAGEWVARSPLIDCRPR